eukprot:scaffold406_cov391-Prasinococcus_capsulatus_cf.AAC.6
MRKLPFPKPPPGLWLSGPRSVADAGDLSTFQTLNEMGSDVPYCSEDEIVISPSRLHPSLPGAEVVEDAEQEESVVAKLALLGEQSVASDARPNH